MFYPLRRLFAATSLALLSPLVSAHTVWLEATDSATDYAVRFGGHAGVRKVSNDEGRSGRSDPLL